MQEEYDSFMANETWKFAPLPKGRKSIGYKWVFCPKKYALNEVVRYKAKLLAKEF